jgi:hypothetical protein
MMAPSAPQLQCGAVFLALIIKFFTSSQERQLNIELRKQHLTQ